MGKFFLGRLFLIIIHSYPGGHALRNWNFEGSKDGKQWITLTVHEHDESISEVSLACMAIK